MTDTKGKKKTASAKAKRTQPKWQRLIFHPEIEPTVVVLRFDEAGNICGVPLKQAQQDAEQLRALDDQTIQTYMKEAKAVRRKNPQLLGKRAQDAMSVLLTWAIGTKWCRYNEWLSPEDQREMLELFYDEADEGIKRAEFKKAESEITTKAYCVAKPYLIDFSEGLSKANDPQLTPGQQRRSLWRMIDSNKRWPPLVEQHVKASIEKRGEGDKLTPMEIRQIKRASRAALRNGVIARWKKFSGR